MNSVKIVSKLVSTHFPKSSLENNFTSPNSIYLLFDTLRLIEFHETGVSYLIPNRYPRNQWSWSGTIEGTYETIAEIILQDLTDAGYVTVNLEHKKMYRRKIRLDKNTICIICGAQGTIKRIFYGKLMPKRFVLNLAKNRLILGRSRKPHDQEAACTNCSWTGSTEIFRFKKNRN